MGRNYQLGSLGRVMTQWHSRTLRGRLLLQVSVMPKYCYNSWSVADGSYPTNLDTILLFLLFKALLDPHCRGTVWGQSKFVGQAKSPFLSAKIPIFYNSWWEKSHFIYSSSSSCCCFPSYYHIITILLPYYHHITIMLHVLPLFSSPSLGQNQKNPQAFGGNRGPRTATRPSRPRRTAMATMATMPRSRPVRSTEPEMLWDNIWNVVECCGMLWEYMEYIYGIIGIYGMNRNKHLWNNWI